MTGVDAVAAWLLGGGGTALRWILGIFAVWLLVGGLPRMRRDAAQKVPQVRGRARAEMREHAQKGRDEGRRGRSPEWWGWTAVWGTAGVGIGAAKGGRYMLSSAWHGWGDHRRRVRALHAAGRELRLKRSRKTGPPRDDGPGTVPPDGGTPSTAPAGGTAAATDRPATAPGVRTGKTVPAGATAPHRPGPDREFAATPGKGADVISGPWKGKATGRNTGMTMTEAANLEMAVAVVKQMQERSRAQLDQAQAELGNAKAALHAAENTASDLAAAGVTGAAWEAFVEYQETLSRAMHLAEEKVGLFDQSVSVADAARGAMTRHEEARDSLAATGGAADSTSWYGKTGS